MHQISNTRKKINYPLDINFAVTNNLSDKLGEIRNLSGDLKGEIFLNSLSLDNMQLVIANELRIMVLEFQMTKAYLLLSLKLQNYL